MLLPLQGASQRTPFTQGDAQGYALVAPSGRIARKYCAEAIFALLLNNVSNIFLLLVPFKRVYVKPLQS